MERPPAQPQRSPRCGPTGRPGTSSGRKAQADGLLRSSPPRHTWGGPCGRTARLSQQPMAGDPAISRRRPLHSRGKTSAGLGNCPCQGPDVETGMDTAEQASDVFPGPARRSCYSRRPGITSAQPAQQPPVAQELESMNISETLRVIQRISWHQGLLRSLGITVPVPGNS